MRLFKSLIFLLAFRSSSATDEKVLLDHYVEGFQDLISNVSSFCSKNNVVLCRNPNADDGPAAPTKLLGVNESRLWSLNKDSYAYNSSHHFCRTKQGLLHSLKYGKRFFKFDPTIENVSIVQTSTSKFIPAGCNYRWYRSSEICSILEKYSRIILMGDSLTRHFAQALFMLLSDDLVVGGFPSSGSHERLESCRCDGQLSEAELCRYNPPPFGNSVAAGYCKSFKPFYFSYHNFPYTNIPYPPLEEPLCDPTDNRPVFFLLATGAHLHCNATSTIEISIDPIMNIIRNQTNCYRDGSSKIHPVFMGLGGQSRALNPFYKYQRNHEIKTFNHIISNYNRVTYNMVTFDVHELTHTGMSSDGYHFLSEVNLIKSMYMLNYLDLNSKMK